MRQFDSNAPALMDLHWFPLDSQCITYKLCMIMFECLCGSAPAYLADGKPLADYCVRTYPTYRLHIDTWENTVLLTYLFENTFSWCFLHDREHTFEFCITFSRVQHESRVIEPDYYHYKTKKVIIGINLKIVHISAFMPFTVIADHFIYSNSKTASQMTEILHVILCSSIV